MRIDAEERRGQEQDSNADRLVVEAELVVERLPAWAEFIRIKALSGIPASCHRNGTQS